MGRIPHLEGDGDEAVEVYGRADYCGAAGTRGRFEDGRRCRKHGDSSATFYKWKAKYGGLDVSEARRLKILTDENAKLKKLLAEATLDNAMLKDPIQKNGDAGSPICPRL
jgi:Transposase